MIKTINQQTIKKLNNELYDDFVVFQLHQVNEVTQNKKLTFAVLSQLIQQGNRLPATKATILTNIPSVVETDQQKIIHAINELEKQEIIHKNTNEEYEVVSNAFALQAFEKIEAENRELKKISKFIASRYLGYQERGVLMGEKDMNYIAPFLNRLQLDKQETEFVKTCQKVIRRKKRLITIIISLVILILTSMTIWAFYNSIQAKYQKQKAEKIAEAEKEEKRKATEAEAGARRARATAEKKEKEATKARAIAEAKEKEATVAKAIAETKEREAQNAKAIAEDLRKKAQRETNIAIEQKNLADKAKNEANNEKRKAEIAEKAASKAANEAKEAEEKAKKLKKLASAKTLALKSAEGKDIRKEVRALLALEAYALNESVKHPKQNKTTAIFKAIYNSYKLTKKENNFNRMLNRSQQGPIRSIVFSGANQFYTTGHFGTINQYTNIKWKPTEKPIFNKKKTLYETKENLYILAEHAEQDWLVAGGNERKKELILIDKAGKKHPKFIKQYHAKWGAITDIVFLDKNTFIVGSTKGKLISFNIPKSQLKELYTSKGNLAIHSIHRLGTLNQFYFIEGNMIKQIKIVKNDVQINLIKKLSFPPTTLTINAQNLIIGHKNGLVQILNLQNKKIKSLDRVHQTRISAIRIHPNNQQFVVASYDNKISLWDFNQLDIFNYQPIIFTENIGWITTIEFSPNGKQLVIGLRDGSIQFLTLEVKTYYNVLSQYYNGLLEQEKLRDNEKLKHFEPDHKFLVGKK